MSTPATPLASSAVVCNGCSLSSLDGIKHAPFVELLSVSDNNLEHFFGMVTMPRLRCLFAERNKISSFAGLCLQPGLEILAMDGNPIVNHKLFRVMALLVIGESLKVINSKAVTEAERFLCKQFGGSCSPVATLLSLGWTDISLVMESAPFYSDLIEKVWRPSFQNIRSTCGSDNVGSHATSILRKIEQLRVEESLSVNTPDQGVSQKKEAYEDNLRPVSPQRSERPPWDYSPALQYEATSLSKDQTVDRGGPRRLQPKCRDIYLLAESAIAPHIVTEPVVLSVDSSTHYQKQQMNKEYIAIARRFIRTIDHSSRYSQPLDEEDAVFCQKQKIEFESELRKKQWQMIHQRPRVDQSKCDRDSLPFYPPNQQASTGCVAEFSKEHATPPADQRSFSFGGTYTSTFLVADELERKGPSKSNIFSHSGVLLDEREVSGIGAITFQPMNVFTTLSAAPTPAETLLGALVTLSADQRCIIISHEGGSAAVIPLDDVVDIELSSRGGSKKKSVILTFEGSAKMELVPANNDDNTFFSRGVFKLFLALKSSRNNLYK